MNPTSQLKILLEKIKNVDSDFRYMGLSDLNGLLLDDNLNVTLAQVFNSSVLPAVLDSLRDSNGEVQNIAVKTTAQLMKTLPSDKVPDVLNPLHDLIIGKDEKSRDIASLALKTIVADLSSSSANLESFLQSFVPFLLQLKVGSAYEVLSDMLDITNDLLRRFVDKVPNIADIQKFLFILVSHPRPAIRKKAASALASSSVHLQADDLNGFCNGILREIKACTSNDILKSWIFCFGSTSQLNGKLVETFSMDLLQLLPKYHASNHNDDELAETCLIAAEQIIGSYPAGFTKFLSNCVHFGLECLKYDPNYSESNGDEITEEIYDMDQDLMDDDDFDNDFEDDEDTSWKVRSAAAKLLKTIVNSYPSQISILIRSILPAVVKQLSEREETVRLEVFSLFSAILDSINFGSDTNLNDENFIKPISTARGNSKKRKALSGDLMDLDGSALNILKSQALVTSKALAQTLKRFSKESPNTCQSVYKILTQVVLLLQNSMDFCFDLFIEFVGGTHAHGSTLDALNFLLICSQELSKESIIPHIKNIAKILTRLTKESYYRIAAASIANMKELVKVIRPFETPLLDSDSSIIVAEFFKICFENSQLQDADFEVRQQALFAVGDIWFQAGDILIQKGFNTIDVFRLLLDRLRNETTRTATAKILCHILKSPLDQSVSDMSSIVNPMFSELVSLLRKEDRILKLSSLDLLSAVSKRFWFSVEDEIKFDLLTQLKSLLYSSDLQYVPLSVKILSETIQQIANSAIGFLQKDILNSVLALIGEPILVESEHVISSVKSFLQKWIEKNPSDFPQVIASLISPISSTGSDSTLAELKGKDQIFSVTSLAFRAKCISSIISSAPHPPLKQEMIQKFTQEISNYSNKASSEPMAFIALHILGECGRQGFDFSLPEYSINGSVFYLSLAFIASTDSSIVDEVRNAAAFALGNTIIGNLEVFMPQIVQQLKQSVGTSKKHYLLLHSLNHALTELLNHDAESLNSLSPYSRDLWTLLLDHSKDTSPIEEKSHALVDDKEKGERFILAECVGKIALSNTQLYFPDFLKRLRMPAPSSCSIVLSAIKFVVSSQRQYENLAPAIEEFLKPVIDEFVALLPTYQELNVKKVAFSTLNSLFHNRAHLIIEHLPKLLPLIYQETLVNEELVQIVQMGPFKHRVDNGLELRKAVYECMYGMINMPSILSQVELSIFFEKTTNALSDPAEEIKTLAELMIQKLCKIGSGSNKTAAPIWMTTAFQNQELVTKIVQAFKTILFTKLKETAVQSEVIQNEDMKKSCMKTLLELSKTLQLIVVNPPHVKIASAEGKSVAPHLQQFDLLLNEIKTSSPHLFQLAAE